MKFSHLRIDEKFTNVKRWRITVPPNLTGHLHLIMNISLLIQQSTYTMYVCLWRGVDANQERIFMKFFRYTYICLTLLSCYIFLRIYLRFIAVNFVLTLLHTLHSMVEGIDIML